MLDLASPPSPTPTQTTGRIETLMIGMGWLPEQPGNGLDQMFYNLATALPGAGVQVRGLVTGSPDVAASSNNTVEAFASPDASLVARCRAARSHIRQALNTEPSPDLVASHFSLYTAPALDLLGDIPLIVHFHGPWAQESATEGGSRLEVAFKRVLEKLVYRRATRCIVLSSAFRDVLHTSYGVPLDRIHVVPGGVNVDRFNVDASRMDARTRLEWPEDRPTILSVRRLAHRMGLDHLIDAVAEVRSRIPDILVHIAGTGPLQDTLQAQIEERDLSNHVRLLGYVPDADLPFAYRAADLSIVPTTSLEGFGLITVESLAAGTPVMVTPIGGLPEIVSPLSSHLVLNGSNPHDLATGMIDGLSGNGALPSAAACQSYAQQHYSWPAIAQQTRSVYEVALS